MSSCAVYRVRVHARSPGDVQNVEPVSFATKVCVFLWMLAVVKTQAEVKG